MIISDSSALIRLIRNVGVKLDYNQVKTREQHIPVYGTACLLDALTTPVVYAAPAEPSASGYLLKSYR